MLAVCYVVMLTLCSKWCAGQRRQQPTADARNFLFFRHSPTTFRPCRSIERHTGRQPTQRFEVSTLDLRGARQQRLVLVYGTFVSMTVSSRVQPTRDCPQKIDMGIIFLGREYVRRGARHISLVLTRPVSCCDNYSLFSISSNE